MSPGLGEPSPSCLLLVELTCGPCTRCTLCDADGQLEPQDQAWLSVGGGEIHPAAAATARLAAPVPDFTAAATLPCAFMSWHKADECTQGPACRPVAPHTQPAQVL